MAKRPQKNAEYCKVIRNAVLNGDVRFSRHAVERMESRGVIESEILHVITTGRTEPRKDDFRDDSWRYAFVGKNPDGDRKLRVIVGIDDDLAINVTVIAPDEEG